MYRESREFKHMEDGIIFPTLRLLLINLNPYKMYLVGGCVRDLLLGRTPKDYDLCTDATPGQVRERLQMLPRYSIWDSGIKHGTLTVIDKETGLSVEITTFRVDGKYSDGRHPDDVVFTPSLEEDLKRRDFTINSIAYDLTSRELIMLDEEFKYDLELGVIRCVGEPGKRFEEDALRMLRAIRFAAQLGFNIEKNTYEAIKANAERLQFISKERIRDELNKILMSNNPQLLELFSITGLEQYAFDGITPITDILNCPHQNPWHYTDVFHHTVDVIKKCPYDSNTRWAALFHDFGKPATKGLKEGTSDHYNYHGHPEVSAKLAVQIMELLKFSNDSKEIIEKFVRLHDYPLSEASNKKFKQKIVEIGEENFSNFLRMRQADAESHMLNMSTKFAIDAVSTCKERFKQYLMCKPPVTLKDLAINGNDLVAMGLKGPEIGKMLNHLLEAVLDNPELNDKQQLTTMVLTITKVRDIMDKDKEE